MLAPIGCPAPDRHGVKRAGLAPRFSCEGCAFRGAPDACPPPPPSGYTMRSVSSSMEVSSFLLWAIFSPRASTTSRSAIG